MNCKNHSEIPATILCEKCNGYFCDSCTLIRKISDEFTAYICKECGGKCVPLVVTASAKTPPKKLFGAKPPQETKVKDVKVVKNIPQERRSAGPSFWGSLFGVLFFPFMGKGCLTMLLTAALFYGLFEFRLIAPSLNLFFLIIYITYFAVYFYKIVEDSRKGSNRLEDLPNRNDWMEIALPFTYMAFAFIVYLAPAQIYFLKRQSFDFGYFVLFGFGAFTFPMVMVKIVITRKWSALNPLTIVVAIFKTFFAYFFLYMIMAALKFLFLYVNSEYLLDYEKIGRAASQLLMVYVLFTMARFLGLFARFYENRIIVATPKKETQ